MDESIPAVGTGHVKTDLVVLFFELTAPTRILSALRALRLIAPVQTLLFWSFGHTIEQVNI